MQALLSLRIRLALCARFTNDIHLDVRSVPYQKLSSLESGEASSAIRLRVEAGRAVQAERFRELDKPGVSVNGDMGGP